VHTADTDGGNLVLQVQELDHNMPDNFGREWRVIPKSPGSNEYLIRNIRYNTTYATWRPSTRPTEVRGVWLNDGEVPKPEMLWRIEPDSTGSYRIYPVIDDPNFASYLWATGSSMTGTLVDIMSDKDGLWQFVEAIVPQAYLFEINLPAVVRPTITKLDIVFVQETPSRQPVTSYMDDICRPLLSQNRIKDEDLRIALIECKTAGESQSSLRFADLFPFDRLRGWRAVDFPWVTRDGSIVVAVLNALKRLGIRKSWTPGALTIVIFNISTFDFRPATILNDIGGEDGCILILLGNQNTITTPAFQRLAGLTSGVVLAVPSSVENIGNFMLEARKTSGLVPLARTFRDARQWYPTTGRLLTIGMTADQLSEYEKNPRKIDPADDVDPYFPTPGGRGQGRRGQGGRRGKQKEEESDFVLITFRNKSNFVIDLTWVGEGTRVKDSKDPKNNWHLTPNDSRVVPMAENVRHKFFMINSQRLIKAFTRSFQNDSVVDLAALYAE